MVKNRNVNLPKLDYLLAYEAVAELESITDAAQVLSISESAVSRKIRLLEEHYGTIFFVRQKQSIRLSQEGRSFLNKISPILQNIRDISDEILGQTGTQTVRISATNSVASLWLLPKLRDFRQNNPHINIALVATDDDNESLSSNSDLIILRGEGQWSGFEAELLFGETIFPVCSSAYWQKLGDVEGLSDLKSAQLIEVASAHTEWMNWNRWLRLMGVREIHVDNLTSVNTYPLSIQAAQNGFGVALGWAHLVDEALEAGTLIQPFGSSAVRTESGYYLLTKKDSKETPARKAFADFLKDVSAHRKKYTASKMTLELP